MGHPSFGCDLDLRFAKRLLRLGRQIMVGFRSVAFSPPTSAQNTEEWGTPLLGVIWICASRNGYSAWGDKLWLAFVVRAFSPPTLPHRTRKNGAPLLWV